MVSTISFSKAGGLAAVTVTGAEDMRVGGYGTLNGTGTFGLSETEDSTASSVFNMLNANASDVAEITMDSTDNNYSFGGYNIYATFDKSDNSGYNVELNTYNSVFDFSGSTSGAFIMNYGANTTVKLGGSANRMIHGEDVLTPDGLGKTTKWYNNLVFDLGTANNYISSSTSQSRFETLEGSTGAYVQGNANDAFYIGGNGGVFQGVDGYNLFKTSKNAQFNLLIGGVGYNRYEDYGSNNAYLGSYSWAGVNGNDYINFFGNYGLAKASTANGESVLFNYGGGSYNAGFTGDTADFDNITYNFKDIANDYGWSKLADM